MLTSKEIESEIEKLKKRNARVELDKRWETSWTRKLLLIGFTYLTITIYFLVVGVANPLVNAVVPAIGFLLSTLALTYFKDVWKKYIDKG